MLIVPLLDVNAQTFTITLNNQFCRLNVYQKLTGLFLDLLVQDVLITGGRIARDRDRMVREVYLGFVGDLMFADMQGGEDPSTPGLGSRFLLFYLSPADLPGFG